VELVCLGGPFLVAERVLILVLRPHRAAAKSESEEEG